MMWPFRRRDRSLDDEIDAHLEMAERDALERGASVEDARAAARRDFGNIPHVKEAAASLVGWPHLEQIVHDVARAARRVRRAPALSASAIVMVAVAVGLTTALFSLLDALVLRPVPFPGADRLTTVRLRTDHTIRGPVSPAVFRAWRDTPVFDAVEAYSDATMVIGGADRAIATDAAYVSPGLVGMLGARPILGRTLTPDDARDPSAHVLIAERLWRELFGGSAGAIGSHFVVDGAPLTVTGVLPDSFRFPSRDTVIWIPADFNRDQAPAGQPTVVARIVGGLPRPEAMRVATDRAHAADSSTAELRADTWPITGQTVADDQQRAAWLLAGGAVLVFLVLCANVASLLVVRFGARHVELGISTALGASRRRLVSQVFAETCVIGVAGGVAGTAVAVALLAATRVLLPNVFFTGSLNPLTLDARALAVAAAASFIATILAGVVPALMATRPSPTWTLGVSERAGTESRHARWLTRGLLIAEVAFACTLLVGAASLVRSFRNLSTADRGFDPRGLVTAWVVSDSKFLAGAGGARAVMTSAEASVRALPGVTAVAWSNGSPRRGGEMDFYSWHTDVPGAGLVPLTIQQYPVGPDFFAMYGIPLIKGRTFQSDEDGTDVVIGDRIASALWPGTDPVGHSFSAVAESGRDPNMHFTVIGVAKDVRQPSLNANSDVPGLYAPMKPNGVHSMLNIKCGTACPSEGAIRAALRPLSPALKVFRVTPLEQAYAEDLVRPRATAVVSAGFSLIALLAAAAGLFSVLSYAVSRRQREFGIRVALGCSPATIRGLVFRDGLTMALAGAVVGSGLAWLVVRLLASLEYGVSARDPLNWAVVMVVISAALAACWRPARRAMRVDPSALLRQDV